MRILLRVAVAVLTFVTSTTAFAHDPWESNGFAHNPDAPNNLVLRTNRGIGFSSDGGVSWRFLCRAAFGNFLPTVGVTTDESALLGTFDGLSMISNDGCDNRELFTPMSGLWVFDIQRDPSASLSWLATTSRGLAANGVFRSTDNGFTWQALGELDSNVFFKQIRTSGNGQRAYVSVAQYYPPTDTTEERVDYSIRYTDDHGAHWTAFPPIEMEHDDKEMVLLDVDPANPDRVFIGVHVCRETNGCFDETRGQRQDRVLVSNDRGETWTQLFQVDEIAAFEINNEHIWIGDWWGGLWRMDSDGSDPTELHTLLKPGCLHATDDELFVCGTDIFGFLLARSTDNGMTLVPIATSENILGNPVCGPSDGDGGFNPAVSCRMEWGDLCRESYYDDANPPLECAGFIDAGVPMLDAGQSLGTARGGGCSCQAAGAAKSPVTGGGNPWLFTIAGLWMVALRRRPHRSAATRDQVA